MKINNTDVLIIGGGPAGTTVGALLRKKGFEVVLLEKGQHPRFHIGESLLPMNLPILERLGVLDKIKEIGVPKPGADFTVGNSGQDTQTFHFDRALGNSPGSAFEVRRSEFDQVLFRNCQEKGVQTFENMEVRKTTSLGQSVNRVEAVDSNGDAHIWQARFLIDASGRDTFLARKNGWKKRNPRHASAAVFTHFKGVKRRAGTDQGNISIYWFESGWVWMIPLRDDIMSIGVVSLPAHLRTRKGTLDDFLVDTLANLEEARERMVNAKAIMPAQATGNYSYVAERMAGPGFVMIGDAFAFIDPVFSSGVYLAMHAAEQAVPVAEAWLTGNRRQYRTTCKRFERGINRGIANFSWFIYRFTTPVMKNLMSDPRNILQVEQAVISMLAGDVFNNPNVARRLLVFKVIYAISWLLNWRSALAFRKDRIASVRAENDL
jgi:flavin-dependent dehydrogenase